MSASYIQDPSAPVLPGEAPGRRSVRVPLLRRRRGDAVPRRLRSGEADAEAEILAAALRAEQARGAEIRRAFSQYVSPDLVDRLMANPDLLNLGGETRDITVLFADVRGFTAIAEAMKGDPQRLTRVINAIMCPLSDIVISHGGTIDKYMGDCVMAFWGAPVEDPQHPAKAVAAGQAMLAALPGINALVRAVFGEPHADIPEIQIGIGVNTGDCVVGNLGCQRRFDYSVLGDPVNVASRLEGLCKSYGVPMLIGEATAGRLAGGVREIDRIAVRGRAEPLAIYAPQQA
jgi:adenylate cyclase